MGSICAQFTLLLSDVVKLLAELFVVLRILGSLTLAFFQNATDVCNVALHLAIIKKYIINSLQCHLGE